MKRGPSPEAFKLADRWIAADVAFRGDHTAGLLMRVSDWLGVLRWTDGPVDCRLEVAWVAQRHLEEQDVRTVREIMER